MIATSNNTNVVVKLATTVMSGATARQPDELEPSLEAPALVCSAIRTSIELDAHCLSPARPFRAAGLIQGQ